MLSRWSFPFFKIYVHLLKWWVFFDLIKCKELKYLGGVQKKAEELFQKPILILYPL